MDKHHNNTHTRVGDTIRHAGHSVDEFSEKMGSKSDEMIHQGERMMHEYTDSTVAYIRKNPLKATLIAAGVGMLLARILK